MISQKDKFLEDREVQAPAPETEPAYEVGDLLIRFSAVLNAGVLSPVFAPGPQSVPSSPH